MSDKIRYRNHPSLQAAIEELMRHGYTPLSDRLGLIIHSNGKTRLAVARETRPRSQVWHLVPPPDRDLPPGSSSEPPGGA